jgi:hypothetical protein
MIESHTHDSHSKFEVPLIWFMGGKFRCLVEKLNLANWVQHEEVSCP